ncbi:hypothetical protein XELAEV_18018505mg [Xenopus laevis]|uniref:Major facilitator superfamily (MFS) profile domain-containing protein n=1 Tax=Xenopus laevis TaxID=8355 RepID=A0A974DFT2_XENLA|nr:hypothetical protein XELAEV_18018505mg [Xenopus laevis]
MTTCIGLFFYSFFSFGCTFIPQQGFWLFMLGRLFVASMAESCLRTVPLMIADLCCPDQRTRVLGFYTCIKSVCCILACLFGTPVVELASLHWLYALWTTPGLGLLGLVLAIIIMKDPQPEGMDEEADDSEDPELICRSFSDLKQLLTNCSFLTSTAGALCYAFVYGAKNSWVRKLFKQTRQELPIDTPCLTTGCNYDDNKCYKKWNYDIDAVLCGIGLIVCAPMLMLFIFFPEINIPIAYVFIAISGIFQAICQVPMLNMKLNIVSPKLQQTANIIHRFFSKLLGSVVHVFFVQLVSEEILEISPGATHLSSMQFALAFLPVVAVIGGVFFFITAHCIKKKQEMPEETIAVNP